MENKKILIIDDDKCILRFFQLILQRKGYYTDTAETGKEALKKINDQSYDVVFVDLILPDTNGLNLLKSIPPLTKKIVMTGVVSEEYQKKAYKDGALAYLIKPVKPEELLQIISDLTS